MLSKADPDQLTAFRDALHSLLTGSRQPLQGLHPNVRNVRTAAHASIPHAMGCSQVWLADPTERRLICMLQVQQEHGLRGRKALSQPSCMPAASTVSRSSCHSKGTMAASSMSGQQTKVPCCFKALLAFATQNIFPNKGII